MRMDSLVKTAECQGIKPLLVLIWQAVKYQKS